MNSVQVQSNKKFGRRLNNMNLFTFFFYQIQSNLVKSNLRLTKQ